MILVFSSPPYIMTNVQRSYESNENKTINLNSLTGTAEIPKWLSEVITLNPSTLDKEASPAVISITIGKLDEEINQDPDISNFNTRQQELLKAIKVIVETSKYTTLSQGRITNDDTIHLGIQAQIMSDHNKDAKYTQAA